MGNPEQYDAPVAIVGGGVVGLATALALVRQGIECVVFERRTTFNSYLRAHVCNPRTMEIFKLWGVEEEVRAAALPEQASGRFVWRTAVAGEPLGEVAYFDHEAAHVAMRHEATRAPEVSCAQDVVEEILRARLRALGGSELHLGSEVVDLEDQGGSGAAIEVQGRTTPVSARYLIAADGAGSGLRDKLGIRMEGPGEIARFISIYLHVDLSPWTAATPAVLYWVVNSSVQGVFISMDGKSRYTFHYRVPAEDGRFSKPTEAEARELICAAIGSESVEPDIREIGRWQMSGQVAERYRSGDVFLIGDAAHRFPPTGGFGMNTGIQDAHNLAWKLAAVLRGWAPDELLDSYDRERRPVAGLFRSRSVHNFERLESLASWSAEPLPIVTRLETPGAVGLAERERIRGEVEAQRDHFDKLALELGFSYQEGALANRVGDLAEQPDGRHPYRPQAAPGARAPLVPLTRADGEPVATTELFETRFVLLARPDAGWREAASRLAADGLPIESAEIGRDLLDPEDRWADDYGVGAGGAVLVRPDGHVAWRARLRPENPERALREAVAEVLAGGERPLHPSLMPSAEALAARVACEKVFTAFHARIDAGVATEAIELFTSDACFEVRGKRFAGIDEIRGFLSKRERDSTRRTRHLASNFSFDLTSQNRARATAQLLIAVDGDGAMQIEALSDCSVEFERDTEGRWLMRSRKHERFATAPD